MRNEVGREGERRCVRVHTKKSLRSRDAAPRHRGARERERAADVLPTR